MLERSDVEVGDDVAHVWSGGTAGGVTLMLLHGAWAGAAPHWSPVWDRLAATRRVVAPELPRLGARDVRRPPRTIEAYARWVVDVMDVMGVERAVVVGNSFGGAIAWCATAVAPARIPAVVLVNGAPLPALPAWLRHVLARPPLRRGFTAISRRSAYSVSTATRAFADPRNVPSEIDAVLHDPHPVPLDVVMDVVLESEPCAGPSTCDVLLLWGGSDRLSGSTARAAQRLHRRIAGSELVIVPAAGHLPQVEQPDAFVTALTSFLRRLDAG